MTDNKIEVFNLATGDKIGEVKSYSADEAKEKIDRARIAQKRWAGEIFSESTEGRIENFTSTGPEPCGQMEVKNCLVPAGGKISKENGKVLLESFQMEVFTNADVADYFANRAQKTLAPKRIEMHLLKHRKSYLHYKPRGIVLIISPWNFPFTIPFGEVIMSLLAGNAVILKPASLTPLIALKGRELFDEAGLDADIFQVVPCPGKVGSQMIGSGGEGKLRAAAAGSDL